MMGWLKVGDPSAVAEARRRARRIASAIGLNSTKVEHVAIVTTEISQNILRHGGGGKMLIQVFGAPGCERLYVIGVDQGPGITRLDRMLEDGVSTLDSPGTGLGAIRRLSDQVDIDTGAGRGTTIAAEFTRADPTWSGDHAALRLPHPGEYKCGDSVASRISGSCAWYLVCDGLGHGAKAAAAASAAKESFLQANEDEPALVIDRIGDELQRTRGAVAAVVRLDAAKRKMDYAAVGNIATIVVQEGRTKRMPVRDGLLGGRRSSPHTESLELHHSAMLVMHSDGVASLRRLSERLGLLQRSAAVIAARLLDESTRERDDSSILVARMSPARAL